MHGLPLKGALIQSAAAKDADGRAWLALAAADQALKGLTAETAIMQARRALAVAHRMMRGHARAFEVENELHDDRDEGVLINEQVAESSIERAAWLAVASALACAAQLGYRRENEPPGPLVAEVRDVIADLETQLRIIPGVDWHALLDRDG